jgi:hypothetical protein
LPTAPPEFPMNRREFMVGTGIVGAGLPGTSNIAPGLCTQAPQQILQQI